MEHKGLASFFFFKNRLPSSFLFYTQTQPPVFIATEQTNSMMGATTTYTPSINPSSIFSFCSTCLSFSFYIIFFLILVCYSRRPLVFFCRKSPRLNSPPFIDCLISQSTRQSMRRSDNRSLDTPFCKGDV